MRINSLSFKFTKDSSDYFFKDLSADFAPNQVHFIQGDNGIGKSTLFNILQGTIDGHASLDASITLNGTTYTTNHNILDHNFTQQVHTVQQDYNRMIADKFTFTHNLQLANLPMHPGLQALPQATFFDVITTAGINPNTPAHLLSGGQRQLLAILMALQKPTKILLLDEPTATLDKKNAKMVLECLQHLAIHLNVTMLIICHDKELVDTYAKGNYFVMQQLENGTRVLTHL